MWGEAKHEAPWIPIINQYIYNIAKEYHDYILNFNSLSHIVLDYFNTHKLRGHDDAIHWCAGGMHRYGNLLIQDKLYEILSNTGTDTSNMTIKQLK